MFVCSLPKLGWWCIWYFCHRCWSCWWWHWYRLLGAKWQHSWLCFCSFQMPIFNVQNEKLSEKLLCICFSSILIDKACDASSVQFPVKELLSLTSSSLCCLLGTGSCSVKVGHPGSCPALHQLHPPLCLRSEWHHAQAGPWQDLAEASHSLAVQSAAWATGACSLSLCHGGHYQGWAGQVRGKCICSLPSPPPPSPLWVLEGFC